MALPKMKYEVEYDPNLLDPDRCLIEGLFEDYIRFTLLYQLFLLSFEKHPKEKVTAMDEYRKLFPEIEITDYKGLPEEEIVGKHEIAGYTILSFIPPYHGIGEFAAYKKGQLIAHWHDGRFHEAEVSFSWFRCDDPEMVIQMFKDVA